ncbi:MAG: helix-turn-helix domain-containing protein [Lactococcus lactis]
MENIFYQRLDECIRRTHKSYNRIERELGYAHNALHNYKYNGEPSGTRLVEIAHYFGVTPEYLIGLTPEKTSPVEQFFQSLDDNKKKELCILCHRWLFGEKIRL